VLQRICEKSCELQQRLQAASFWLQALFTFNQWNFYS
jgi:hypothetical protein